MVCTPILLSLVTSLVRSASVKHDPPCQLVAMAFGKSCGDGELLFGKAGVHTWTLEAFCRVGTLSFLATVQVTDLSCKV